VELFAVLCDDTHWQVRCAVAENPRREAADAALGSADRGTREVAAQRPDLTAAQVGRVLDDPAREVRGGLARSTPDPEMLARLVRDPEPFVRACTLDNRSSTPADAELLATDRIAAVRGAAAASRRLRRDTVTRLARDRSVGVQWEVLTSYPERLDVAETIAESGDELNAGQARLQLERPRRVVDVAHDPVLAARLLEAEGLSPEVGAEVAVHVLAVSERVEPPASEDPTHGA
jgi:hypothetical protein